MGGWREDIQGKQRSNSLALDRDVFVQTNLGKVQGFFVYLYDKPYPDYLYRPVSKPVDEIVGQASVFLGIPYAQPPVDQGRFKVYIINYFITTYFPVIYRFYETLSIFRNYIYLFSLQGHTKVGK